MYLPYNNIGLTTYNILKVVDCTYVLNEWVYPANGDLTRLRNIPPREFPEYVRRFTQDTYLCIYIQPDVGMYGDFELEEGKNALPYHTSGKILQDSIFTDD